MKIGILGTRGIPNTYGGFEQFAQNLALGLIAGGHEVWVYSSSGHLYREQQWNGIHIIHCKDPEDRMGTAGQFIYDWNCFHDARQRGFDILLQLGYTSSSVWYPWWPKKSINIVNMDGLEWKRAKYNRLTQRFLKMAEKWAADHADLLIADSMGIQEYLKSRYQKESVYIPYGANVFENPDSSLLKEWSLQPGQYFLVVARMEPENNVEVIIRGYLQSVRACPLVIIGNTNNRFGRYLTAKYQAPDVLFLNGIYDQQKLNNLRYYSALYFHGHSVGGTNPSLLEAMACSCHIVAHDNPFNKAILTDCAKYFLDAPDISQLINQSRELNPWFLKNAAVNLLRIKEQYSWASIISQYERVFLHELQKLT